MDLWQDIISLDNLFHAYQKASRGKRSRPDVAAFEIDLEDRILAQHREKKNNRRNLNIDEFWCMGCDKPIQLSEFEITPVQPNGLVYRIGRCPDCGTKVSRGGIK